MDVPESKKMWTYFTGQEYYWHWYQNGSDFKKSWASIWRLRFKSLQWPRFALVLLFVLDLIISSQPSAYLVCLFFEMIASATFGTMFRSFWYRFPLFSLLFFILMWFLSFFQYRTLFYIHFEVQDSVTNFINWFQDSKLVQSAGRQTF